MIFEVKVVTERSKHLVAFREFVRCLIEHGDRRIWGALALMGALGLVECGGLLLLAPLMEVVGVGPSGRQGGLLKKFITLLREWNLLPSLSGLLAGLLGLALSKALLNAWQTVLLARIQNDFTRYLQKRFYEAMVRADWLFFTRQRASDVIQILVFELGQIAFGVGQLLALLATVLGVLVNVAFALSVSVPMTAFSLVVGAFVAFVMRPLAERMHAEGQIGQGTRKAFAALITEHVAGMKVAKSHGLEASHLRSFQQIQTDMADNEERSAKLGARRQVSAEIWSAAGLCAFVFVAVTLLGLGAGEVILLAFVFNRLTSRLNSIQLSWQRVLITMPSFEAGEELRNRFLMAAEPAHPGQTSRLEPHREITLENVSFSYHENELGPAVTNLSFSIPARKVTAICGPSGAGKSTLADLLLGLLTPNSGRIFVDDTSLEGAKLHDWRQSVGYVPQDTFLFHNSVRANLLWARSDATENELWEALKTAAADRFVARLPDRLDTVIGDRGVKLSGGERQRLALARALLRRPSILVLDEATSALDTENERFIQEAIEQLHGQLTIILIAHRLSTVRAAEQIIVLENGHLVETGTWDELMAKPGGTFWRLASG